MNKPTPKQLDSLVKLLNEDAFHVFFGWLNESYIATLVMAANTKPEPERSWMQGKAQELAALIEQIKGARLNLEAVEQNKDRGE